MSYLWFIVGAALVVASLLAGWQIRTAINKDAQKKKTLLLFIAGIVLLVVAQFTHR